MKSFSSKFSKSVLTLLSLLFAQLIISQGTAAPLQDPLIKHDPKDGIVKLYGAGGPHTAIKKVADVFQQQTGTRVEIIAGPEKRWTKDAQKDADILWGTAQQSMTAFLETYNEFSSDDVFSIYIRPSVIAVKKGNPKRITGFDDLLKSDMKIVVTEGAGVYNTSGTGVWEDIAGRLGRLEDIKSFRKNIVAFAKGSGASFRAFKEKQADAWITWPNWPITNPDKVDMVEIDEQRRIYRDLSIILADNADPQAKEFIDFLISDEAVKIMSTEGWRR